MGIDSIVSSALTELPVLAFKITIAIGLARLALSVLNSLVLSLFYNALALFQRGRNNGSN